MVDPILDLIRATVAEGLNALGITRESEVMVECPGLRLLFRTRYSKAASCGGLPHVYASRDAWIAAGRPLPDPVEDEWLDVETSIGLIVSMKPERARQARCRLQVLESRERATRDARLDAQLDNQWFADHWEPLPVLETSERERAAVRRKLDYWLECKRGERELRDTLGY